MNTNTANTHFAPGRLLGWPLAAIGTLLAIWVAAAPLAGAVVAPGRVQAEFGRKVVQHQEGGLLQALHVREGQAVQPGDVLMVIGDAGADAAMAVLQRQLQAERLRAARATAELALATRVTWPAEATDADARAQEQQRFDSRRRQLQARLDGLAAQAAQARQRTLALAAQVSAAERSAELSAAEVELNRELVQVGFIQKPRLMALERVAADATGRSAAARGQLVDAQAQRVSIDDGVAQARADYQRQAADDLADAGARLQELQARLRAFVDRRERQTVRSPVQGTVMALRVSAPGTAIAPREPLLEIAPAAEALVIEAQIAPRDVDHVHVGSGAEVHLAAMDVRRAPPLPARVLSVSPDVVDDGRQPPHYVARVQVEPAALASRSDLRLQAGMPAEVAIATAARTPAEYLLQPLGVFTRRALREP